MNVVSFVVNVVKNVVNVVKNVVNVAKNVVSLAKNVVSLANTKPYIPVRGLLGESTPFFTKGGRRWGIVFITTRLGNSPRGWGTHHAVGELTTWCKQDP